MLKFKNEANLLRSLFYRYKNDIDVYVEDQNDEEFYLELFKRVFETKGLKINKVIALGGKKNVIETCRTDQDRTCKRIYVIDGDCDIIFDFSPPELKYFYRLPVYCIENYLLDENAIIEILHDYLIISREQIKSVLTFNKWLKFVSPHLIELFYHYAIIQKYCKGIDTLSNHVGMYCQEKQKVLHLDEVKIKEKIEELKILIIAQIGLEQYQNHIFWLYEKWEKNVDTALKFVSGKDYLIPLLDFRFKKFRKIKNVQINRETLRLRLAKLCSIEKLIPIINFING